MMGPTAASPRLPAEAQVAICRYLLDRYLKPPGAIARTDVSDEVRRQLRSRNIACSDYGSHLSFSIGSCRRASRKRITVTVDAWPRIQPAEGENRNCTHASGTLDLLRGSDRWTVVHARLTDWDDSGLPPDLESAAYIYAVRRFAAGAKAYLSFSVEDSVLNTVRTVAPQVSRDDIGYGLSCVACVSLYHRSALWRLC